MRNHEITASASSNLLVNLKKPKLGKRSFYLEEYFSKY